MRPWPVDHPAGDLQPFLVEIAHHRSGAAQLAKFLKDQPQPRLNLLVRMKCDFAAAQAFKASWKHPAELASRGLRTFAGVHTHLNLMQFGLAHYTGQPK